MNLNRLLTHEPIDRLASDNIGRIKKIPYTCSIEAKGIDIYIYIPFIKNRISRLFSIEWYIHLVLYVYTFGGEVLGK